MADPDILASAERTDGRTGAVTRPRPFAVAVLRDEAGLDDFLGRLFSRSLGRSEARLDRE